MSGWEPHAAAGFLHWPSHRDPGVDTSQALACRLTPLDWERRSVRSGGWVMSMQYADKVFLRFADEELRAELFDAPALEQLARTSYDAAALGVSEPFAATFDEVRLGVPLPGGGRIDALWRGAIVAHALVPADVVTGVAGGWDCADGDVHRDRLSVAFAPPASTAVPLRLPVVVGVKFRDAGFSVGELVAESRADRERVESLGLGAIGPVPPHRTREVVIAWIVPSAAFDTDWPGAAAGQSGADACAARRARAGRWLSDVGIAVAVADT
jgi:hypothetical protein